MNRYMHLNHSTDTTYCGPLKTTIGILLIAAMLIIPTALISHRLGYVAGVINGVDRAHQAIDMSIQEGLPFTFVNNDVQLVVTVKTDSKVFRKNVRALAEQYELVRYRVVQEFGPDDVLF